MKSFKKFRSFYLLVLLLIAGCGPIEWLVGTSTTRFEKRRYQAIRQHVACEASECYQRILAIGDNQKAQPVLQKHFAVFQASARKRTIVFYDVPGQIDTTEVAIFITPEPEGSLIEVVSRSSSAQQKVARVVFDELSRNF